MGNRTITTLLVFAISFALTAHAGELEKNPTSEASAADTQVLELEKMCQASSEARAARHAATTLYERLGKEEGINRLTREIVRLHVANPEVSHFFEGTENDLVAKRVADFMISGLGGPNVYQKRPTLPDSHRHMHLTNADFVAAGGDVIQAMTNLGYGQDEIDEVVCTLVALRPMVVLE